VVEVVLVPKMAVRAKVAVVAKAVVENHVHDVGVAVAAEAEMVVATMANQPIS
jgi:hypothetical protein